MTSIARHVAAHTNLFSLTVKPCVRTVKLRLVVHSPYVTTKELPNTYGILAAELPDVLETECFNDEGLSFDKEVVATEIGHLFEHILLVYLCEEKAQCGFMNPSYSGQTCWNWREEVRGSFNISIYASLEDYTLVLKALSRTIALTEHVLQSNLADTPATENDTFFNFIC